MTTTPADIQTTTDESLAAFIIGDVTCNHSSRVPGTGHWRHRQRGSDVSNLISKVEDRPTTREEAVRRAVLLSLDIAGTEAPDSPIDSAMVNGLVKGALAWVEGHGGLVLDAEDVSAIHKLIDEQLPEGLPDGDLVEQVRQLSQALSGERIKASNSAQTSVPFSKGADLRMSLARRVASCMGLDPEQVLARLQGSDPNFAAMVATRLREGLDQRYLASDGDDLSLSPNTRSLILGALLEADCTASDLLATFIPVDLAAEELEAMGREAWSPLAYPENPFERLQSAARVDGATSEMADNALREAMLSAALRGEVCDDTHPLLQEVAQLRAERDRLAQENSDLKVRLGAATIPEALFEVEDADEDLQARLQHARVQVEALQELIDQHASSGALRVMSRWVSETVTPDTDTDAAAVAEWLRTRVEHDQRDTFKYEQAALDALGVFLFQRAGAAFDRLRRAMGESGEAA